MSPCLDGINIYEIECSDLPDSYFILETKFEARYWQCIFQYSNLQIPVNVEILKEWVQTFVFL